MAVAFRFVPVLLLLGIGVGPALAQVSDSDWRRQKAEFEQLFADPDRTADAREQAVRSLGTADRSDAVDFLLKLMVYDLRGTSGLLRKAEDLKKKIRQMVELSDRQGGVSPGDMTRFEGWQAELNAIYEQFRSAGAPVLSD